MKPSEPPHNIECEQALIGALLLNNDVANRASFVRADHFFDPLHGRIWSQAMRMIADGMTVSPVLIAPHFRDDPSIADVGGLGYLARLAGAAISIFNARDLARSMVEDYRRRAIGQACENGAEMARDMSMRADDAAEAVESALLAIGDDKPDADGARSIFAAMAGHILPLMQARQDGTPDLGVTFGLPSLDNLLGGLRAGQLVVLAGRPGMGKTTAALFMARAAALAGHGVHFASLEMSPGEVATRQASLEIWAHHRRWVQYDRIDRCELDDAEARDVISSASLVEKMPLRLGASKARTVGAIAADVRRSARVFGETNPLKLIVVDHLGWIRAPRERASKTHEVGDVVRGLKELGVAMGAPVMLCSQLNRQVESRDDKRPYLSDLRDSGDIEQDADKIVFAYRPEYYVEREKPEHGADVEKMNAWEDKSAATKNRLVLTVAKNRQGKTGSAELFCDVSINAISEWR